VDCTLNNPVTLTFDLLTSESVNAKGLPAITLQTLWLIARFSFTDTKLQAQLITLSMPLIIL